jgi:hypothetical protein
MGDRGATGGAWGARDEASWWPGGAGELQHQQQLNEDIARSTAAATHQLYSYKMTSGFSNNGGDNSTPNYDYRLITSSNAREQSPQQPWWYGSGTVETQPTSSPTVR